MLASADGETVSALKLPLQPEGLTLAAVTYEEAVAEVRLGQTVIVGEGERYVLRESERAVANYSRSCTRLGWGLVKRARLERQGMPV